MRIWKPDAVAPSSCAAISNAASKLCSAAKSDPAFHTTGDILSALDIRVAFATKSRSGLCLRKRPGTRRKPRKDQKLTGKSRAVANAGTTARSIDGATFDVGYRRRGPRAGD